MGDEFQGPSVPRAARPVEFEPEALQSSDQRGKQPNDPGDLQALAQTSRPLIASPQFARATLVEREEHNTIG